MKRKFKKLLKFLIWGLIFTLAATGLYSMTPYMEGLGLLENEKNTIKIYEDNDQSVVNITNIEVKRDDWTYETVSIPKGVGSGFVWNTDGYIVTNFHVVAGGNLFLVSFNDDTKQYKAKLAGSAPRKDIALLKLEEKPKNLVPLLIGNSEGLKVGQKVVAIGNPFGLDHTITEGIISAIGREIPGFSGNKIYDMIQTDASINPGNSGGPLFDSRGRLIGMNAMIFSKSGSSAGLGFAVPVDTISRIVPQLIQFGKEIRPGLGVVLVPTSINPRFGIKQGVIIRNVFPNSSASKSGLQGLNQDQATGQVRLGDVLVKINGTDIKTEDDIFKVLDQKKIGDTINITSLRGGKLIDLKLTLMRIDE